MDLLPADRARLARREGPAELVRHLRVRGGHQRGPRGADLRRGRRERLVREGECLGGGLGGRDPGRLGRPRLRQRVRPRIRRPRLRPRGLRDVAFVGLHQVRERPELLAVPVERCDAGELGLACRARLVRLANDVLRRGDPGAGVARGRDRGLDVGFVRKRAGDLGQRGHAGDRRRRHPLQRHPAPSPGARSPDRPIPTPAAVRAIDPPPFAPRRAARAPRRSARAPCRGR